MIQVTVYRDCENTRGILIKGHAGYGEYGSDILCASVSALTLNAFNSIEQFTDDAFDGSVDEEIGLFEMHFTESVSPKSQLLMDSLVLGLQSISESYGKKYIRIRFEEV
ncbi:MAG: ribosomal-processing cysteine protease Prp [bacterium]|nr:ribosomal-processing cysteine protease Prp [bacterium]